jgi:hypothetical protein
VITASPPAHCRLVQLNCDLSNHLCVTAVTRCDPKKKLIAVVISTGPGISWIVTLHIAVYLAEACISLSIPLTDIICLKTGTKKGAQESGKDITKNLRKPAAINTTGYDSLRQLIDPIAYRRKSLILSPLGARYHWQTISI